MDRYRAASHAMQSGVAMQIQLDGEHGAGSSPKYLRTGVNAALVDNGALAALLIQKGLITADELAAALADGMEAEVQRFERLLSERLGGKDVTLS